MEKIYKNIGRTIVETNDVENISSEALQQLVMGDIVFKKDGEDERFYVVAYFKKDEEMCLVYTDSEKIEEVGYEKEEGAWQHTSTTTKDLGGGGVGSPYALKEYELDLDNMTFSCSNEDAEFIFQNNPTALSLDGVVVIAKDFTDDESKQDYSRGYYFYEYGSDNSIYLYDISIYFDGEEYSFDVQASAEIGGGGATKKEIDISDNSDTWTQEQLEDVYTNKYDIVSVLTSSNTIVLRKVSEYQGFGVLYWTFMPQQGIVINILTYDEHDGYEIQTQTRMPIVSMEVDGSAIMSEDQDTLKEVYEKQPDILYVDAGNDGEQSYRKQTAKDDTLSYSCIIGGFMIVVYITEDRNANPHTYSITIERYDLSSLLVSNQ